MRRIDIETLKQIHNALDELRLGNYELAVKQLNEIIGNEELNKPPETECNHSKCPVTEEDMIKGRYCTLPLLDYR